MTAPTRPLHRTERDDWPKFAETLAQHRAGVGHARLCEVGATDDKTEIRRCTQSMVAVRGRVLDRLADAIDEVVQANQYNPMIRRVLLVDGPFTVGKTFTVFLAALRRSRTVWNSVDPSAPDLCIPWVYIEASGLWGLGDLTRQICRFIGLPVSRGETAEDLVARLRRKLRDQRTEGIIVDDAHMFRHTRSPRNADGLKHLITSLPVTFVFVGAALRESPLLTPTAKGGASATLQISRRATLHELAPYPSTGEGFADWCHLVRGLADRVHLGQGDARSIMDARVCRDLLLKTGGLPNGAHHLIRQAGLDVASTTSVPDGFRAALSERLHSSESVR